MGFLRKPSTPWGRTMRTPVDGSPVVAEPNLEAIKDACLWVLSVRLRQGVRRRSVESAGTG